MHNDDPRLTAYALGELEPPERAEVEALLQNDPAAAQEVAEMRELAALVRRHLSTEDAPPLAPQQRDDILSEMSEPQVVVMPRSQAGPSRRRVWIPVAIAACAAVLAGSGVLYYEEHMAEKKVAIGKLNASGGEGSFFGADAEGGGALATEELKNVAPADVRAPAPTPDSPQPSELTLQGISTTAAAPTAPTAGPAAAQPFTGPLPAKPSAEYGNRSLGVSSFTAGRAAGLAGEQRAGAKDATQFSDGSFGKSDGARPLAGTDKSGLAADEKSKALGSAPVSAPALPPVLALSTPAAKALARELASAPQRPEPQENEGLKKQAAASEHSAKLRGLLPAQTAKHEAGDVSKLNADDQRAPNNPVPAAPAASAAPAAPVIATALPRTKMPAPAATPLAASSSITKSGSGTLAPRPDAAKDSPVSTRGQQAVPGEATPGSNQTRSFAEWQVTKSWDRPVRRFNAEGGEIIRNPGANGGATPATPQPGQAASEFQTGLAGNTGAINPTPGKRLTFAQAEQPAGGAGVAPAGTITLSGGVTLDAPLTTTANKDMDAVLRKRLEEAGLGANVAPAPEPRPAPPALANTESYDTVTDNPFLQVLVRGNETSTFSIDVDTASYSNVRRFLTAGQRPPKGAVRIEELVNYFKYDYAEPKSGDPLAVKMDVASCPWTPEHRLLRIALKARELDHENRPQANLVFLIDVSGSMQPENRLPLVKKSLRLLVEKLGPQDTVGIVVYAGASGIVLEPTNDRDAINAALDRLNAGGSTNGGEGIKLAYKVAAKRFEKGRTNRVILATDGDFNVGVTNQSDLTDLITQKAKSGVFLTVLGFGYGNLKDSTMEKLADKGNGNYAYIDNIAEGRKVLVEQMAGTLVTVAKDVKLQIEFNPAQIAAYRLIGYENRLLAKEDFNDDTKDAGEVGAGHTVTALYELVPAGQQIPGERETTQADPLKYQPNARIAGNQAAQANADARRYDADRKASAVDLGDTSVPVNELLTLKLRWKAPDGDVSTKREFPLTDAGVTLEKSSKDFRWAAAVAEFGMILRDSPYKGQANWSSVRELAIQGQGKDADGHRIEFLELIGKAEAVVR
jgi:Ca-activated chloride channel family protein